MNPTDGRASIADLRDRYSVLAVENAGIVKISGPNTDRRSRKEINMAIGNAMQRGAYVYVYDERGQQLTSIPAGTGAGDGLQGYTATRVNIRRGDFIYSHDEHGRQVGTTPAR
jgi:hypothetical protein